VSRSRPRSRLVMSFCTALKPPAAPTACGMRMLMSVHSSYQRFVLVCRSGPSAGDPLNLGSFPGLGIVGRG
jgi:hypothetical protein